MDVLKDLGITAPCGIKAAGVSCGIKKNGDKDLCVIYSDVPAVGAGLFTANKIKAAPVKYSKGCLERGGKIRAIVVNSGNANACTGAVGLRDASEMASLAADNLKIKRESVLVASTGVIGEFLPMEKIHQGIREAASRISSQGGKEAAEAIMTTDTFPKEIALRVTLGDGSEITIGGMAKGSGMIAPNMGTLLAFVTTDVAIEKELLEKALRSSVDRSFNMISVDGDMSTNDTIVLMANGLAENRVIAAAGDELDRFQAGLNYVTEELAKMIARDGEGATKLIEVNVLNSKTYSDAKNVAFSIANSNLVKTAFFGGDANWGRIMAAVGYSDAQIDENKIDLYIGDELVVKGGERSSFNESKVDDLFGCDEIKITVDLGLGCEKARVWTCDLSYDYVKINADYRT